MAGKKVDGGEVKVKITDGGSLKNLGNNAKKAGKDVGSVAKNVQESDRRLKSLSQQTSNSTKAFSKQAQTIGGGLVPIYATIAAQVFAVSAAFRFLQDAMETRNMIEGQKAFGAVTGQAFGSITMAVQQATDNMLTFKEAAQATAIGIASGLARGQLTALGAAAKNASLALGRDLTDSFNRLIRGVTKAEPELLDELGIILRLEPATEKYALAIGKTRNELNAFERSQAVANEVLDQAERKFGAIAKIMDPDAFALGQFAKEFDDMMKEIKVKVIEVVIPVVNFLKDNLLSLVGVFGLLAAPIVSQILPTAPLDAFAKKAGIAAANSRTLAKNLRDDAKLIGNLKAGGSLSAEGMKQFQDSGRQGMQGMLSGMDMSGQSATMQKAAQGKKLNAKELGVLKRHLKQKGHILNQFEAQERAKFDRYIKHQELGLKGSMTKAKLEYKQLGIATNVYVQKSKAMFNSLFATIARGASFATSMVSKLMGAFGWISLVFIAVDAFRQFFKKTDEGLTKFQEEMQETTKLLTTLTDELYRMKAVSDLGLLTTSVESVTQVANALKSTDIADLIGKYNSAIRGGADKSVIEGYKQTALALSSIVPEMQPLMGMFDGTLIDKDMAKPLLTVADSFMAIGMALDQMPEQLQSVSKALQGLISGAPTSKFTALQKSIQTITNRTDGSMGEGAFEARKKANADMSIPIAQRSKFKNFAAGAGGKLDLVNNMKYNKFDARGNLENAAYLDERVADFIDISKTQLGLDGVNAALGTSLRNEDEVKAYFQKLLKGEGREREDTKSAVQDVLMRMVGEQLDNPAVAAKFDSTTAQMGKDMQADLVQIGKDEANSKILLDIEKNIVDNIKEEERIRKSNVALKMKSLGLTLEINRATRVGGEFAVKVGGLRNKADTAKNELDAAELIANQTYATQNGLVLDDLIRQKDIAQEKVDLANEELRIAKEYAKQAFERAQEVITVKTETLGMGSFGNSFFNKQRDYVLNNQDNITKFAENAADDVMAGGGTQAEADQARIDAIDQQTEAYAAQALELEKVNGMLSLQASMSKRLTEGLANDMAGALVEVAKGTKTMKEAFSQMAISILADITKMIIRQLILNALMAMVGMVNPGAAASLSAFMGGTPARQGGIMSPGAGGGYRSYRSGGVADGPEAGYPATLHGTEAVVPLGNDREIPVKMLEGNSGTNNVTVNVTMSDGGATQDVKTEGEKAKAFGVSISAAVQQEIVKQQRTGGLLNSY
jgi:methylphosphotriester-DNA--protein-cysteine methyltransferase